MEVHNGGLAGAFWSRRQFTSTLAALFVYEKKLATVYSDHAATQENLKNAQNRSFGVLVGRRQLVPSALLALLWFQWMNGRVVHIVMYSNIRVLRQVCGKIVTFCDRGEKTRKDR